MCSVIIPPGAVEEIPSMQQSILDGYIMLTASPPDGAGGLCDRHSMGLSRRTVPFTIDQRIHRLSTNLAAFLSRRLSYFFSFSSSFLFPFSFPLRIHHPRPLTHQSILQPSTLTMNSLVRLLVLSLVASSTMAIPAPERADPDADVANPKANFHDYIHSIDEDSIQHALQLFDKFRHGISRTEPEPSAEDPSLARMNLVKRSPANSSAAVDPTQPTAAPSTQPPSTSDSSSSSSSSSSSQGEDTTSAGSTAPTTTGQTPTTSATTTSGSESTSSSQSSASTAPSTSQPTSAPSTSSSSTSSSSTSQSQTSQSSSSTTDQPTSATTTQGPRTTTYKSTTTLPNGQQSTVTQVTVVHPTETATGASRTGPAPGLQTDSAASTAGFARELWLMVGGAALVAMAL